MPVDWSQFTPVEDDPPQPRATAKDVDWSQFQVVEDDTPQIVDRTGPKGRRARPDAVSSNLLTRARSAHARGAPITQVEDVLVSALRDRGYSFEGDRPATGNIDDQGMPAVDPFAVIPSRAGLRARGGRGMGYKPPAAPAPVEEGYFARLLNALGAGTLSPTGGILQQLGEALSPQRLLFAPKETDTPGMSAVKEQLGYSVLDPVIAGGQELSRAGQEIGERSTIGVQRPNSVGAAIDDPAEALRYFTLVGAQSAPMMAAAAATRNPEIAADLVGVLTGAQSYGEDRLAGIDPNTAMSDAFVQALLEKGFEAPAMAAALDPAASLASRAVRAPLTEAGSELLTGAGQYAAGQVVKDQEIDPGELMRQAIDSAVVGLGLGAQSTAIEETNRVLERDNATGLEDRMAANDTKAADLLESLRAQATGEALKARQDAPLRNAIQQALYGSQTPQAPTITPGPPQPTQTPTSQETSSAAAQEPDFTPRQPVMPELEPGVTLQSLRA
jgi:hypothetical protein